MTLAACLLCSIVAAASNVEDCPADAMLAMQWADLPEDVRDMIAQIERGIDADSLELRYQAKTAWEKLLQRGDPGVMVFIWLSRNSEHRILRSSSTRALCGSFASHPQAKEFILTEGLHSYQSDARFTCLYCVGECRWGEARDVLFDQMQDRQGEDLHRFAAAKSLAQFGDIRSLPTLVEAALHKSYYPRHCGNVGLAALTGKSLNDFDYQDQEGSSLLWGVVIHNGRFDAVKELETRIARYTACRDYLQWLRNERPELYATFPNGF